MKGVFTFKLLKNFQYHFIIPAIFVKRQQIGKTNRLLPFNTESINPVQKHLQIIESFASIL